MKLWEPGQGIVMREVWRGKVYSIMPLRVVQDSHTWTALYLPPNTLSLFPHTRDGTVLRIPEDDWVLRGEPWEGQGLCLVHAGLGFTFSAAWDQDQHLDHWKIDLVDPVRRAPLGFDYMDQFLDIIVSPDRSTWYWKDEDEVQIAERRGIFTPEQVSDLYQRGERAIQALQANEPPFDGGWENWIPDPICRIPFNLPEGWKEI
jgi:hypothetical protein